MKNVQKTREQQVQLKHLEKIGFKIVDIAEMLAILATAALLLIGSEVTAKAKPVVTYGKKEQSDFAAVLFDGFTDDEIAAFERYHIKILDNISRKRSDK